MTALPIPANLDTPADLYRVHGANAASRKRFLAELDRIDQYLGYADVHIVHAQATSLTIGRLAREAFYDQLVIFYSELTQTVSIQLLSADDLKISFAVEMPVSMIPSSGTNDDCNPQAATIDDAKAIVHAVAGAIRIHLDAALRYDASVSAAEFETAVNRLTRNLARHIFDMDYWGMAQGLEIPLHLAAPWLPPRAIRQTNDLDIEEVALPAKAESATSLDIAYSDDRLTLTSCDATLEVPDPIERMRQAARYGYTQDEQ